jgi:hypothetical protein
LIGARRFLGRCHYRGRPQGDENRAYHNSSRFFDGTTLTQAQPFLSEDEPPSKEGRNAPRILSIPPALTNRNAYP